MPGNEEDPRLLTGLGQLASQVDVDYRSALEYHRRCLAIVQRKPDEKVRRSKPSACSFDA